MARIAGVDIPNDKPVAYSLAYIYGIGIPTGKKICADAKVDPTKRVKDLTEEEITKIRKEVEKITFCIMQLAGIPAHCNVNSGSDRSRC